MKKCLFAALALAVLAGCGGGKSASSRGAGAQSNTFEDSRDGTVYRKTTIGAQTWMAENLIYDIPDDDADVCYENSPDNCKKYGRLYDRNTVRKACPAGWRLPSEEDWGALLDYAGGSETAGTKLKSKTGWESFDHVPAPADEYGFSALPGGYGNGGGFFSGAGSNGYWWCAEGSGGGDVRIRYMDGYYEYVDKDNGGWTYLYSVRCIQDLI